MRWVFLVVAIVGFALVFASGSPGWMGIGLVLGCASLFGFALALASERISQNAQSENVMFVDPEVRALHAKTDLAQPAASAPRAAASAPNRNGAGQTGQRGV